MSDDSHRAAARSAGRRHPYFWAAVAMAIAVLGVYAFAARSYLTYGPRIVDFGWTAAPDDAAWYVSGVQPALTEGKLVPGDRIVSVTTARGKSLSPVSLVTAGIRPGDPYTLELVRDGETLDVTMTAPQGRSHRILGYAIVIFVVSLSFFIVGLPLGLLRPESRSARLGSAAFFATAIGLAGMALDPIRPFFASGLEQFADVATLVISPFEFALAYHFYRSFPESAPCDRVWRILTYTFYVCAALLVVPNVLVLKFLFSSGMRGVEGVTNSVFLVTLYFFAFSTYMVATLGAGYAVLIRNYHHVASEDERRRIRWVVYGTAASVIPFAILHVVDFVAAVTLGVDIALSEGFFAAMQGSTALFVLIPVTLGYVILKHRVFDIDVAVRLGVRYLLARGVLEAVLAVPILVLVYAIWRNRDLTVAQLLFENKALFALEATVLLSLAFRSKLAVWVDRKFFRDEYDRERILVGLVEDIKQKESISDLSRRVSDKLEAALHPKRMLIVYREEEGPDLTVGHSSGDRTLAFRMSSGAELLRMLEGESRAHDVPLESDRLPEAELALLRNHGITLVVPMSGTDGRLMGLLLLGEKRSEEPYSARDRSLLEAIAGQMAIVRENVQLKSRVARDNRIRVEVLGRMDHDRVNLVKECPRCGLCYDSVDVSCEADGAELTLSLPVERTVEGKYRLERLIGRGGMGAVYMGTDVRLARSVAVKVLTGAMFGDQAALRRFEREAQASARLTHGNIVRVYDYGAIGEAGAFLVLELLRGHTLRRETQHHGRLTPEVAAELFGQLFDGMIAAHEAGVIHRDLKPENIFIGDEGGRRVVKILDFGLAKMRRADVEGASSLTAPGTVMGTFGYMSPEQLSGGDVDERSDVFALGVMLYEALVGSRPFGGRTWAELLAATAAGEVRLPGEGPEVRALEAALRRSLAADPSHRFGSVAEMRREVLPALLACRAWATAAGSSHSEDDPTKMYGNPR